MLATKILRAPLLWRHYFWEITPAIVVLFFLIKSAGPLMDELIFLLAYFWNVAIETPGFGERIRAPSYRFSVSRLIYKSNQFLRLKMWRAPVMLSRHVLPLLLCLTCVTLAGSGHLWPALAGAVLFEVLHRLGKKSGFL